MANLIPHAFEQLRANASKPLGFILASKAYNSMGNTFDLDAPTLEDPAKFGTGLFYDTALLENFTQALLIKIGKTIINRAMYQNKLKKFKKGTLPLGGKVEEILEEAPEAFEYSLNTSFEDVYGVFAPKTAVIYHHINRMKVYKLTTDWNGFEKAFYSWESFDKYIEGKLAMLYSRIEIDEFMRMKAIFTIYGNYGYYKEVIVDKPDINDKQSVARFAATVKKYSGLMTYPSREFNHVGFERPVDIANQSLFLTESINADVQVGLFAKIFHQEPAKFEAETVTLDKFSYKTDSGRIVTYPGCLAVLAENTFLQVYDRDMPAMPAVTNAAAGTTTHMIHVQQIMSSSEGAAAIAFIDRKSIESGGKISSIKIMPATKLVNINEPIELHLKATLIDDANDIEEFNIVRLSSAWQGMDDSIVITPSEDGRSATLLVKDTYEGTGEFKLKAIVTGGTVIEGGSTEGEDVTSKNPNGATDIVMIQVNQALMDFQ